MDSQRKDSLVELFKTLKTKEINKIIKKYKLDKDLVKHLKKERRKFLNRKYAKASRERKKNLKNKVIYYSIYNDLD